MAPSATNEELAMLRSKAFRQFLEYQAYQHEEDAGEGLPNGFTRDTNENNSFADELGSLPLFHGLDSFNEDFNIHPHTADHNNHEDDEWIRFKDNNKTLSNKEKKHHNLL